MKLEFHNKWVRLVIEFLPSLQTIRRYRVIPRSLDRSTRRVLRQRISRQLSLSAEERA